MPNGIRASVIRVRVQYSVFWHLVGNRDFLPGLKAVPDAEFNRGGQGAFDENESSTLVDSLAAEPKCNFGSNGIPKCNLGTRAGHEHRKRGATR